MQIFRRAEPPNRIQRRCASVQRVHGCAGPNGTNSRTSVQSLKRSLSLLFPLLSCYPFGAGQGDAEHAPPNEVQNFVDTNVARQ